ncbi:transcription factor Jun-like [Clytia hemisphaerica]|uniref:BZIP domain-containing protein n=1 Tax=Clytia hemisphaerica TaxID=252671 RepID=A0A7M5XPA3_9CNID
MSQVAFLDRSLVMSQNYNKSNLKLDLNEGAGNSRKRSFLNVAASPAILASPDLKLLKLGSPELEKLIINTGGFIPTPTPNGLSFAAANAHNEHGTEDQESFLARGFIEALQRLQQQDGPGTTSAPTTKQWTVPSVQVTNESISTSSKVETSRWPGQPQSNSVSVITPTNPNTPRLPEITAPSTVNLPISSTGTVSTMGMTAIPRNSTSYVTRPTELSNPTSSYSSGLNLPSQVTPSSIMDSNQIKSEDESLDQDDLDLDMNPIDLDVQEHIKHQRKKLRNRLAAQRCRRRKIEREDTLKVKVKELKAKNSELTTLASQLRMQVCDLKQKVMLHVNEGCQVFLKEDEKSMSAKGL